MTRSYTRIQLRMTARFLPGWKPNNEAKTPYMHAYEAPEFEISRDTGEHAYLVTHKATGEQCEVPLANVRCAVLQRVQHAEQPQQPQRVQQPQHSKGRR
jgi:hypothetical protein